MFPQCRKATRRARPFTITASRRGTLPRRDAIAEAGRAAVRLLLGVVPILVIAGIVEGFISPTATPPAAKFAIGASLFVVFAWYLARGWKAASGRTR